MGRASDCDVCTSSSAAARPHSYHGLLKVQSGEGVLGRRIYRLYAQLVAGADDIEHEAAARSLALHTRKQNGVGGAEHRDVVDRQFGDVGCLA